MKRLLLVLLFLFLGATPEASHAKDVELKNWSLGLQVARGQHSNYDVFGKDDILTGPVGASDGGIGLMVGRRFSNRFQLGVQFVFIRHLIKDREDKLINFEFMLTGTVFFLPQSQWRPFLRGGVGGAGIFFDWAADDRLVASLGVATVAGGGIQFHLSRSFALELETTSTFANFFEVQDSSLADESWQVRTSNYGWRVGLGLILWF